MKTSTATVVGVSVALVAAIVAIRAGTISPTFTASHASVPWPAAVTPALGTTVCAQCDMLLDADSADLLGLPAPANPKYVTLRSCGNPDVADAGFASVTHARALRSLKAVDHECEEVAWQTGWPQTELWVSGTAGDPSGCRCSNGSTCTFVVGGAVAPKNRTYQSGVVTGAGCRIKACTELAGYQTSMPAACQ